MISLGQQLAAQRKIYRHICEICGKEFDGIKTAKTCSNKCRSRKRYLAKKKVDTDTQA